MGIVQVGVIALLLALLPPQNVYSLLSQTEKYEPKEMLKPPTPAPYPVDMLRLSLPELTAGGVVIIDIPSRVTLYEKNPDLRFFPASTTKIMTALIVLDSYSLDDVVSVNTVISEGQVMDLIKGE
ncbi:MAG: D-alanyl-D-alanine carboxypeptidase, partial [Patescibacteria group bacterium]